MRLFLISQAFGFLFFFTTPTAFAMEPLESDPLEEGDHGSGVSGEHEGDHGVHGEESHHRFFVGAKGSYLAAFGHGSVHQFGGGGVFFEVLAIPNWLEIELFVRAMIGNHLIALPIDLLLKIPFHLNETVHPFIGLGPTVVPVMADGESEIFFGGVVAIGSYFWLNQSIAIVAELNYNLIYEHGVVNEIGVNAGVAIGF